MKTYLIFLLIISGLFYSCKDGGHWVIETQVNCGGSGGKLESDSALKLYQTGHLKLGDTVYIRQGYFSISIDTIPYEGSVYQYNDSINKLYKK